MKIIIETKRLILRQFNLEDTEFIIRLVSSEGWLNYIGDRNIKTSEAALAYLINGPLKSYDLNGFGLSLVALKQPNTPIGMCGFLKRESLDGIDLGFAFLPEYMGKGYAYEIASATLQFGKEVLKLQKVLAITVPQNSSSIKLLNKLAFQYDKKIHGTNKDEELLLFYKNLEKDN